MQKENFSPKRPKVNELIRRELSKYLLTEDSYKYILQINTITIMEVDLSPDLKNANIFVAYSGEQSKDDSLLQFFNDNSHRLKDILAKNLKLKYIPKLNFKIDQTLRKVQKIEEMIKKVHQNVDNENDNQK